MQIGREVAIPDPELVLLLIQFIGDVDPITAEPVSPIMASGNGIVMINSDRIWNLYAVYRSIQPALLGSEIFSHLFQLRGLQLVTAVLSDRISFSAVGTAVRVDLSDRWEHRKAMMDRLGLELDALFKKAGAYQSGAVGPILPVVPIRPPVPGELPTPLWAVGQASTMTPDANGYNYSGSPYWREWKRW